MNPAWFPYPLLAGPAARVAFFFSRFRSDCQNRSNLAGRIERAHSIEVLLGIDARRRRAFGHPHRDPVAVPQRAQLLKSLEALELRRRERRIMAQEADPIGVQPIMAIQ